MCVALAPMLTFALSAASAVVGYMGQQQQYKAAMAQKIENDRAAAEAARHRYDSINNSLNSEQKKASSENLEGQIAGLQARSKAKTAAGEAGLQLSGLSVEALLSDFTGQQERYLGKIDQNYQTTLTAYEDEKKGAYDTARARINSVAMPTKPSFAGAALRIADAGLGLYKSTL